MKILIKETGDICNETEKILEESRILSTEIFSQILSRRGLIADGCNKDARQEASKLIQAAIRKDPESTEAENDIKDWRPSVT